MKPSPPPEIVIRAEGETCRAALAESEWSCPNCGGRGGFLSRDEHGYEVFRRCDCRRVHDRIALFNSARIGRRYQDATLDSFVPATDSQDQALQLARDFTLMYPAVKRGLVFWGPVGTGKTHLVLAMFRKLTLDKGVPCRFVDYGQLLNDLRRAYSEGGGDAAYVRPLFDVELLLIDELGKGKKTDWELSVLDDLVSRRYNAGRITLCTTNFAPADPREKAGALDPAYQRRLNRAAGAYQETLQDRMEPRIFSRLCEMCEFVELKGPDHRRMGEGR